MKGLGVVSLTKALRGLAPTAWLATRHGTLRPGLWLIAVKADMPRLVHDVGSIYNESALG